MALFKLSYKAHTLAIVAANWTRVTRFARVAKFARDYHRVYMELVAARARDRAGRG